MGDISLREMFGVVRRYTTLPDVDPMGLRQIVATLRADGLIFPIDGVSCRDLWTVLAGPRMLQVVSDPPPDHEGDTWSSDMVNGKKWFEDTDGPRFAWVQVESPADELDAPVIAAAGRVIGPEVSSTDNPFSHPFGNDWECYVEVDPRYRAVLSPVNGASGDTGYPEAAEKAPLAPETGSHQGVLGVEFDAQLVPDFLRPLENDRIAVFGRWIIDAGHIPHTEIHPPLLMVTASAPAPGDVWTTARVISRPYLVSQAWPEGSLRDHLMTELEKAASIDPKFSSGRVEAHPTVWAMPFSGRPTMTVVLRTPTPPPAGKSLQVRYALTARSGISVEMFHLPPDGVQIKVTFDSDTYRAPSLPPKSDNSISVTDLGAMAGLGTEATIAEIIAIFFSPKLGIVLTQGILTDSYTLPPDWQPSEPAFTLAYAADLHGAISVLVNDNDQQPYPLFGLISVGWS